LSRLFGSSDKSLPTEKFLVNFSNQHARMRASQASGEAGGSADMSWKTGLREDPIKNNNRAAL
jgi:hypothetical protein